ncbi:heme oxygenase domain-containing protein [Trichoderma breve]|uniref:Heme oxygenase domain-containing protein n=1 Tax=Trichoderma breve TaxID=2034170 RepID=A0A9W9JQK4_9HYPO|nr:heme oxygenase domain-containing protein [Trichoderma breve]KAJ4863850.1 heme oxygenase domain-containing protein [Trichoderma breve]
MSLDNASSPPQKPLAFEMVAATRELHTRVNRLVVSRLPLALPPQASDAGPYISGLLHFLPVYMTFEKLWQDIIPDSLPKEAALDGERPKISERMHTILKELRIPQLFRSDILRADIKSMTGWSDDILDNQIDVIKRKGKLCAFISHIKQIIPDEPHTLIAYSYNFFMALFAGGRFIRASFEKAGDEFWETVPMPIKPAMEPCRPKSTAPSPLEPAYDLAEAHQQSQTPLQFWRFNTAEDGEDLKRDYKQVLLKWEGELSPWEREDIVRESAIIMENIESIVGHLDSIFAEGQEEEPSIQIPKRPSLADRFVQTPFVARIRDSFMIARERGVRSSLRSQSLDTTTTEEGEHDSKGEDAHYDNVAADIELCPGVPKSMRFAKSLPIPPRRHVRVVAAKDGGLSGKLAVRSSMQPANPAMPRPVLVGLIGLFLLYIFIRIRGIMSVGTVMVM